MKALIQALVPRSSAKQLSFEELWAEAEQYGAVRIWSRPEDPLPNKYHCTIEFGTIAGTKLSAESAYFRPLLDALGEAVDKARLIADQFKERR